MIEIVRYTASWCGPCLLMNPVFEEISKEYPSIKITKVDIDTNSQLAKINNIKSIPAVLFYKDGILKDKQIGAVPKSTLKEKIDKIK